MAIEAIRQLLALTLVSSAAITLVLLARWPVRRAFGASVAYRVWLLVPVPLVAMLLPGAPGASSDLVYYVQIAPVYSLVRSSLSGPGDAGASVDWYEWLLGAWGFGAAICLVLFLGMQRAYVRGLGKLSEERGTLRAASSAGCPALLGILRPRVVLPNDFEKRYTTQEQALVLAHENVHLERRDTLWNALVVLLRCVFWFNPLVHVAASFMRADQELACDAAVIDRHPASRRTYADAMLKTELADAALPVGCHWHSPHTLMERLAMLKTRLPSRTRRALGGALFAVASVVVAFAAWAAEPAAPAAAPQADTATTAPRQLFSRKGFLRIGPDTPIQVAASVARTGPNGEQILEGDVLVTLTPSNGPHHRVKVLKTPNGEIRQESVGEARQLTVKAQKVTLTRLQDGSAILLQFEDGSIEETN